MRWVLLLLVCVALVTACVEPPVGDTAGGVTAEVDDGQGRTFTIHGDDPLPPDPPGTPQLARQEPWPCVGTGTDGRRIEFLYVHGSGAGDLAGLRLTFESLARSIVGSFVTSAQSRGQYRAPRFATTSTCDLLISDVTVSQTALSSFDVMIDELAAKGFNRPDRKYHAWVEASAYCGIGTLFEDDRPGPENYNNSGPSYARSDRPCWGDAEVHEIAHNLGAVQLSAPNSTGALHSRDEHDVMSYPDGGSAGQMVLYCPEISAEDRLDCRTDDYFDPAAPAASYLATHWNVARSSWLETTPGTVPPTTVPPPPPTTVPPPTTSTTVGQGKTETQLEVPERIRVGEAARLAVVVSGTCRPTGTVSFYVSGKLLSRQPLASFGDASLTVSFAKAGRFTIRASYDGSTTCAKSSDSVRKRVSA